MRAVGLTAESLPAHVVRRFWRGLPSGPGCWEWSGARSRGYGYINSRYAKQQAHRVSWVLHFGAIPDGLLVCHHCDNKPCVRPDHLYLGTIADNTRDAGERGLMSKGTARHNARLDPDLVIALRQRRGEGVSWKRLAREFSVNATTIRHAVLGHTWAHIQEP